MPALVSWRAARPAVRPPPTITTVHSLSTVTIATSSAEVSDRLRLQCSRKGFTPIAHHIDRMGGGKAWIANHFPEDLANVATVDGIGETGLHKQRIDQCVEPCRQ